MAQASLAVAHSFEVWLPLTMTWAYNQLKYAEGTDAFVLATATRNLDHFPWRPLYVSDGRLEARIARAGRRAGVRVVPAAFRRAFREHRPSVLHSHFGYRGWADLVLARRYGLAHVVTFYGHDVTMYPRTWPVWRRRYDELFAAADMILCEGPYMSSSIVALGCPENKIRIQRLGVELDRLPCRPRELAPGEPVRVLVAGAFRPKKGIPSALEAVAAARAAGLDLRVTVIGGSNGSAGEEEERLRIEDVVRKRRLGNCVAFSGMVPYEDLIAAIKSHHIFLSPSVTAPDGDSEGGAPVTIIEAAASGMPVVSTTHCDIPQVVEDGRTGLLAPEGDQEALAHCLSRLAGDPGLWPRMGVAAGELARRDFDVRRCAAQLVGAYREAVCAAEARGSLP